MRCANRATAIWTGAPLHETSSKPITTRAQHMTKAAEGSMETVHTAGGASAQHKQQSRQPELPRRYQHILCLDDFQQEARRFLPRQVYSYVAESAETCSSFHANRNAY